MPYAIKGKTVVKKDSGEVVGHSKNPKKYMRVLQAVEHGFRPSKQKHHSPPINPKFDNPERY